MKTIPLSEYAREIAKEEGIIEGMEKGMEKGMEQGMEKGMEKGMFEVARRMLARSKPLSEIVDITGLNEQDILSITAP
jgi:predicted transposase/invertase (TIGR01784 family)